MTQLSKHVKNYDYSVYSKSVSNYNYLRLRMRSVKLLSMRCSQVLVLFACPHRLPLTIGVGLLHQACLVLV